MTETADLDEALWPPMDDEPVPEPIPEPAPSWSRVERLLKGINDRLDRVWASEHTREIALEAANDMLQRANAQIMAYVNELTAKGLGELAQQIARLVVEVIE